MSPKDIFSLFIRCLGVVMSFYGLYMVYISVLMVFQVEWSVSFSHLIYGVPLLIVGIWFLRGAPRLVSFCYGKE